MKLLIITQAVDREDPVLGFFHSWIEVFARHVESIHVIALRVGTHALPSNVHVHSLGKEEGDAPTVVYAIRFWRTLYRLRGSYSHVFVHMNPEYLMLAGWYWRISGIPAVLWYMHKRVSWRLRVGALFAQYICTASPRSMRLVTRKKRVVGHGIRASLTPLMPLPPAPPFALLTVGRLSRIKRIDLLIRVLHQVRAAGHDAHLIIVGGAPTTDAQLYVEEIHALVHELHLEDAVTFVGAVSQAALAEYFSKAHVFLHASNTGSLDKAALEPLLAGIPVVTTDDELAQAGLSGLVYAPADPGQFAQRLEEVLLNRVWEHAEIREDLRAFVLREHDLEKLIPKILAIVSS